eukprot:CAMPEP_0198222186 /NCGR_PEP_ID=MMETSP1445-20131203/86973_1 /TAXON_ID=36898 /ORGANISM="Pyramimonas sp., Strain CCMP2087" /LENGTH=243 /DNA_ID=CAMNT_0043900603 /DNA_START=355 /DNA_END=1083 /DNA_ORIENTATION=-
MFMEHELENELGALTVGSGTIQLQAILQAMHSRLQAQHSVQVSMQSSIDRLDSEQFMERIIERVSMLEQKLDNLAKNVHWKMDQTKTKVELVEQQVGNLEVRLQDTDHCATNARAMLESKVDWEAMSSISSRLNAIVEQLNSNEQMTHDMHEKFESNERELESFKRDVADQSFQVLESVECVKNELLANEDTLSLAQIAHDYQSATSAARAAFPGTACLQVKGACACSPMGMLLAVEERPVEE